MSELALIPTILMIDDSAEDVELLSINLRSAGVQYKLDICETTDQASGYINACKTAAALPKLVVLDLHLPPKNGEAVFQEIRKSAHLRDFPVLIMTTSASPIELNAFRSQPNTEVATKPYSLDEYRPIVDTIRRMLNSDATSS
jgi:CheY-like chemotaxis protein